MIALFIIGIIALILSDETIPHEYAMVGLLLLLFYKLPKNILPILALLCVLVPFSKGLLEQKKSAPIINTGKVISVDSNILKSYVGVYQFPATQRIVTREGNKLFWGDVDAIRRHQLVAVSETKFINPASNSRISFMKDSTGKIASLNFLQGGIGKEVPARKLQIGIEKAKKSSPRPSYKQFVIGNSINIWNRFKTWSWSNFFWGSDISNILPFFLIGLYAGRRRIFYDVAGNKAFLKKVMWWGFIFGSVGMFINLGVEAWNFINDIKFISYPPVTRSWFNISWDLGVMAMTFAYAAGLTLLLEKADPIAIGWKKRLSFLAPVGRMGFTNYLLHIIPYVIFFHYGFNLSGKIGPFYRLLLALPVYVSLIFLSRWWFKHFTIGPAEWLWRSLTYLKFQPMRLKASNKNEEKEIGNM
jgi:uncharacterized membrane protein YeiB